MDRLAHLLKEHYVNFPDMEVQDAVKFLYQHHMGPGHLIADEHTALARLKEEWDAVSPATDVPLSASLGNSLCRLNLALCKAIGLSYRTVARLFSLTSNQIAPNPTALKNSLDTIYSLPFPREEVARYLTHYRAQGCPMVGHSDRFRRCYSPSYRITSEYYVNIIPVLAAIDKAMTEHPKLRVAIDGPCASGKSTLGAALSEIYNCPLFHMDDFFLRPEQRTIQRLAEPGGNVDYERFSREILSPLLADQPVQYKPWLCHSRSFGPEVTVPPAPLTVVEGCYCLHPDLRNAFHLRIWLETPWSVRRQRLLDRGGPECLARFEQQWIPLEYKYFEYYHIAHICHVHLSIPLLFSSKVENTD